MVQPDGEYGASRYLNTVPASATRSIAGRHFRLCRNRRSTQKREDQNAGTNQVTHEHDAVCSNHTLAATSLDASNAFPVFYRCFAGKSAGDDAAGLRNRNHRNSATVATKAPTESSRESHGEEVRDATKA